MTTAVCYVATSSHLLQTVLSAIQARHHAPPSTTVVVVQHDTDAAARLAFGRVCDEHEILLLQATGTDTEGLHPVYARLFLDRVLPSGLDELLYLDGDTQVIGDLRPLLDSTPSTGGVIAVRDPMVLLQQTSRFSSTISRWWDESEIPSHLRARYVNSGVLRLHRQDLPTLRSAVLRLRAERGDLRFLDQDLLNLALDGRILTAGMEWNFPAFLLGSALAQDLQPRVLHFMSEPRPWQGAYYPWGHTYFDPYVRLVRRYPGLAPYWSPSRGVTRARYTAQQTYKRLTEHPVWQSNEAKRALGEMRATDYKLF